MTDLVVLVAAVFAIGVWFGATLLWLFRTSSADAEAANLRLIIEGLCYRCAMQSEHIARMAEKRKDADQ